MKKEKNYKLFLLGEIREHTTKNRPRKQQSLLGLAFFYTRHQRVSNKKNKKCSKWVIIEWETCVKKKKNFYKLFLLGEVRERTTKTCPKSDGRHWGGFFLPDTRGLTIKK